MAERLVKARASCAGGLKFKSGQIYLRNQLCSLGAMMRRSAPQTRYTLRRITANIMKGLVLVEKN